MRVAILAQSGGQQRRIVLRADQVAKFGRTDWADFAFPEDPALAEQHFAIRCLQDSCHLLALDSKHPTAVNGSVVEQVELQPGDVVRAGQSVFWVQFDPPRQKATAMEAVAATVTSAPSVEPEEAWHFAQYIELSPDGIELARQHTVDDMATALVQAQLRKDAVRWYAHSLPKPLAVLWAGECVEQQAAASSDPVQQSALDAALIWAKDPTEAHRQTAVASAERAQWEGIGGVLAAAACWSGGSLAPEDHPAVPPDERLTGRCVTIALLLLDCQAEPGRSAERYDAFLALVPKSTLDFDRSPL